MNRMMEKEWRSHQSTLHRKTALIIVANAQRRQTKGNAQQQQITTMA